MADGGRTLPPARAAVIDERLSRPDWTVVRSRDPKLLWLDKNESVDPALAELTGKLLRTIDPNSVAIYPECATLYNKLAEHLDIDPRCVLLAPGADGVIRSVFEAFSDVGDVVVHTSPSYAMYAVYSRMFGVRTRAVQYEPSHRGPVLTADMVIAAIRQARPKLVFLPNPDSPTGTVFVAESLKEIIDVAGEVGALILIDEAYHPFHPVTALPWIEEYPHLVVVRTFSKAWGLTGLRLGYGVSSREIARLLHKVRPNYEVNQVAIAVAERMLDHEDEMLASVRRLNRGRDYFVDSMTDLGLRTSRTEGNFLLVAFDNWSGVVHQAIEDLVLYRVDFQDPCLEGFSRFTSTTVELFEPIVSRIRQVIRGGM